MAELSLYAGKDETFRQFLWNSETKQFLGRTGSSWAKIGIFYLIFYSGLAGFFAMTMAVFYQTLDVEFMPTYTPGDGSSLLRHPALGFRPLPRRENVESTLIWYRNGDNKDIEHWVQALNEFIKPYEGTTEISGQHMVECSEDVWPKPGEVCRFQDTWLSGYCHKEEKWGFSRESPCIVLKLNKMIGWEPDVYNSVEELPAEMPTDLQEHIRQRTEANSGKVPKMIWLSCEGENPADREYIGTIDYFPWRGFPAYYFPYRHTPGYLAPIVAVQFNQPQSNVLINIECKAWAKNIGHDRQRRLGIVHLELLKD